MANVATYIIDVTTKGLKSAVTGIKGLGSGAKDASIQYKTAEKHAGGFYNTQAKGIIGTANSTKSFSKLAETMSQSNGLVGAYATLAANIFAVSAAFNALRSAAQVQQVLEGLNASGARTGLTLSVAAKNVKDLSGNLLSMEQAMRSTAQVMSAGFSTKELEKLTVVAKDVSFALGRNVQDSMDRLTRGVVKLEPELLDELGIMTKITESNNLYAATLNKSAGALTNFEKRQGFLNAVVAEATLKFGGLSKSAGNTTAYDKVAAQFNDLTRSIFNGVNSLAIPLAAVFGTTGLGLTGLMLILGSTISKQLLPGLTNISGKATAAAEATRGLAKANLDAFKQTAADLTGHKAYIESVVSGNVAIQDRIAYIKKLDTSMAKYTKGIAAVEEKERMGTPLTKKEKGLASENSSLKHGAEQEIRSRLATFESAQQRASTKDLSATAIGNASAGSFSAGLNQLQQSITAYGNLTDAAGKKTSAFSKTIYGVANSAQFATAAFLRFLPWIGLIVTALGLLKAAWEASKSDALKEFEKRTDNLQEILSKVSDKIAALNAANTSTATVSARASAALIIESNAIREIAEAVDAQQVARIALAKAKKEDEDTGGGNFGFNSKSLRNATEILQAFNGLLVGQVGKNLDGVKTQFDEASSAIDRTSPVFQTFRKNINTDVVGSLEKLRLIDSKLFDQAIETAGGLDKIAGQDTQTQYQTAITIVKNLGDAFGGVAQAVKSVEQAFTNGNKALGDFIIGAADSTPYDASVTAFQSMTTALMELDIEAAKAGKTLEANKLLAGMGANQEKFLTDSTRTALSKLVTDDSTVKILEEKVKLNQQLTMGETLSLYNAREGLKLEGSVLATAKEEVYQQEASFIKAQEVTRLSKSQQLIAEARLNLNKRNYEATGRGMIAQMKAENGIKDIQIQQLAAQKALITAAKARNDLILLETNYLKDINTVLERRTIIEDTLAAQQRLRTSTATLEAKYGTGALERAPVQDNEFAILAANVNQAKKDVEDTSKRLNDLQKRNAAVNEDRALSAAEQALNAQQKAIEMSKSNAAQQKAEGANIDMANMRARYTALTADRNIILETVDLENKLAIIRSGRGIKLTEEVRLINQKFAIDSKAANLDFNNKRNEVSATKALLLADRTRLVNNKEDLGINNLRLSNLNTEIADSERSRDIKVENLRIQKEVALAEKLAFDTRKEGLDIQKESLSYIEKQLETSRALQEAQQAGDDILTEIARKRAGTLSTPAFEEKQKIDAALEAYKFAMAEAGVKKASIELEFALLRAQKQQLEFTIADRRQAMIESGKANPVAIAQLDATLRALADADIDGALQGALKTIDQSLKNARNSVINAATYEKRPGGASVRQTWRDIDEREAARKQALAESRLGVVKEGEKPKTIQGADIQDGPNLALKTLSDTNDKLITTLDKLIRTLEAAMNVPKGDTSITGLRSLNTAGHRAESMGLSVSENDAFGWQTKGRKASDRQGHAKNSAHYTNQAFDINAPGGGIEANSSKWGPIFDKLAAEYREAGFKVLWRVAGHFNHMHVEMTNAVLKSTKTATDANIAAVTKVVEVADIKIGKIASNDNPAIVQAPATTSQEGSDITVDGPKNPATDPEKAVKQSEVPAYLDRWRSLSSDLMGQLEQMGPQGKIVTELVGGIESVISTVDTNLSDLLHGDTFSKIAAGAEIASAAVTAIGKILSASSDAKIANIDREIAAEQKRDGKSSESVGKIDALEKRKDKIAKKAFDTNKKMMMAQAIIATAAGVAQALSKGPAGIPFAVLIGAMGAAQLAIIASTQYQSTNSPSKASLGSDTITIGKRGESVDLAKNNKNIGGELGYLRGSKGYGSNSSNYATVGSAYGGPLGRGYGNRGFVVGEKGPEVIEPTIPMTVTPMNDNKPTQQITAQFHIQAFDGDSVQNMLYNRRGDIIDMLRETANANGKHFLEEVNTSHYKKPNVGATRI